MNLTRDEVRLVYESVGHWGHMRNLCNRPGTAGYQTHGAIGIKVCKEWNSVPEGFLNYFECVSQLEHFGEAGYHLERIDKSANYTPYNVQFVKNP